MKAVLNEMKRDKEELNVMMPASFEDGDGDQPLDVKPRLKALTDVKEEPCDAMFTNSTTAEDYAGAADPPDVENRFSKLLDVKEEPCDARSTSASTHEDDPLDIKPCFKLKVEEETNITAVVPSTVTGESLQLHRVHCDYACHGQDRPDEHVGSHHGYIDRNGRYKCEWCEYSAGDLTKITIHYRTHTGERPYHCEHCGKAFRQMSHLSRHRLTHTGERRHECDVCGKAFTQTAHLTAHRRIHTGEKVRQCEQCGASFGQLSHYTQHLKIHNGVKPYQCHVCSARFARRTHLTSHMLIHTGERPFGCSSCSARFKRQMDLQRHVVVQHTHDYRYRCDRCGKGFLIAAFLRKHEESCYAVRRSAQQADKS